MFVKKLVEKASLKKPGGSSDVLKSDLVNPRLVFHHGIPAGSILLAHDPVQKILAVSTKDGRIKLFGKDNTQTLLESTENASSKFLQIIENQGILLNVNANNNIEVWDLDKNLLSDVHVFHEEITSFTVVPHTLYIYVGDSSGNISVLKVDEELCNIVPMKYRIPCSASRGLSTQAPGDTAVMHILPQLAAESKRILIIYRDGLIILWSIQDSKTVFITGGNLLQSLSLETKKVTAACWACPFGSKVVVGYNNGEIFMWSIPYSNLKSEITTDKELSTTQNSPLFKLNLGYKVDKIPISLLRWIPDDGKAGRLYVLGSSDSLSTNLIQVVLINENVESRTTKLGLHPPEACVDLEIISSPNGDQSKHKQDYLILLGKSGHIYAYDDSAIEKYLLQSQSRNPPSLPKDINVKLPFVDSSIIVAKFITDNPYSLSSSKEEYAELAKSVPSPLAFEARQKDGSSMNSTHCSGFSKYKNLYITGHNNGAINFWDLSCPLFIPVLSLTQQSEDDSSLSGIPLTSLYFSSNSRVLISGDKVGMVRIYNFKPEPFTTQGSSKKGNSQIISSLKLIRVNGAVLSITTSHNLKHLAVGSDLGYVSVIDMEGASVLYEKHIASELCTAIISLQFKTCILHGFEKNVLIVATKDSSVLAIETDTGNILSPNKIQPNKPSKALFMQILDGHDSSDGQDYSKGNSFGESSLKQPLLLICSEKAVYVYSFVHIVQGVKKVFYKKKFHSSSCCWASTFHTSGSIGLVLLFPNGKIEIRSLPELTLLRETSIRGVTFSTKKQILDSDSSVCSSRSGEIVMVNGDQEVFLISVLRQNEIYRHLDPASQVYDKDLVVPQSQSETIFQKEKKKGLFGSVMKDKKVSKAKPEPITDAEDIRQSIEELSAIFPVANFPLEVETRENHNIDEDENELDIDDIDIDDPKEKTKGNPVMEALNKQKLTSKFNAIKGKFKHMKVKNEKAPVKEEPQDEKPGTVDQIKKKYGFTMSGPTSPAKMAESKLNENIKKLQGINLKTTEMQNNAQSFSSMANEVLRSAEHNGRVL
jgi:WD40 repeat protein